MSINFFFSCSKFCNLLSYLHLKCTLYLALLAKLFTRYTSIILFITTVNFILCYFIAEGREFLHYKAQNWKYDTFIFYALVRKSAALKQILRF